MNQPIADDLAPGIISTVSVNSLIRVEKVEVTLNIAHERRGDLRIVLVSPDGTESVLAEKHADGAADYANWTFTSTQHWGEIAAGQWTLKVIDQRNGHTGTLNDWTLNLYGSAIDQVHYAMVSPGETRTGLDFGAAAVPAASVVSSQFGFDQAASPFTVTFSADVGASLTAEDLQLFNLTTGQAYPAALQSLSYDPATFRAVWTFASPLADGNYIATLAGDSVGLPGGGLLDGNGDSLGGDDFTTQFFQLRGDANRDRVVDYADFTALHASFGAAAGAGRAQGDFDYNGTVDFVDYQILALSFGHDLRAAAPAPTAINAAASSSARVSRPKPVFSVKPIVRRRPAVTSSASAVSLLAKSRRAS